MSIARHRDEWISLLEISGPFLSMPALLDAFPQGLKNGQTTREGYSQTRPFAMPGYSTIAEHPGTA